MTIAGTGYVGIAKEATFGTKVDPSTYLPVESSEITQDPQNYYPEQIKGNRSKSQGVGLGFKNEASISQDGEPNTLGLYLLGALGSVATTQPDAAGAPTAYQHVFTTSNELPSFTIEQYDNIMIRQASGSKVDSLKLTVDASGDGVVKLETGWKVKSVSDKAAQSVPDYTDEAPFTFYQVAVQKDGQANDNLKNVTVEISNNIKDDQYTLASSRDVSALPEGMREVKVSADIIFSDKAEYLAFLNGDEGNFTFTFTGVLIGGTIHENLIINLPRVKYDKYDIPMGGSDDEIIGSIEGTALYDATTGGEIKLTLTNTVTSY